MLRVEAGKTRFATIATINQYDREKNVLMKTSRVLKVVVIILIAILASVLVLPVIFSEAIVGTPLPPLQLLQSSTTATPADSLSLDGVWTTGSGSLAGFRVQESFLLQSGTIVGRTSAVTGSLDISNQVVTSGTFQVDLSQLTIAISEQTNNLSSILDTGAYPDAVFTLTTPIDIAQLPTNGEILSSTASGSLTMNNTTHPITLALTGRYDGSQLEALGSTSILVSDWGMKSPIGIHNDAEIEFLVFLQRE